MNFNSWQFLLFLPVVVGMYWLLPHKFRWVLLLIASYFFYMSWNAWLIILIMTTTVTAYVASNLMKKTQSRGARKALLIMTLVICLGILVFFKYINFLLEATVGVIRLFNAEQDSIMLNVILPVGISFYTFQTLSYVVDVYRGDFEPEPHFGYFALYVVYFPQLVAGPIERPGALLPQLHEEQKIDAECFRDGMRWLLSGFFRKVVVADFCGIFVDKVFADLSAANSLAVFAAAFLFLIQIYNDFAGYSEIAMGSARLMGVKLTQNFDRPLSSTSFTEFFRRWHITLNVWFTEYVYIPLGGNRKGVPRKLLNTLIVFALCGIWHGANWTFVLWGVTVGVFVCLETLLRKPARRACEKLRLDANAPTVRFLRQAFVIFLFTMCSVMFRSGDISQIGQAYVQMFTAWDGRCLSSALESLGMSVSDLFQLAVSFVGMAIICRLTDPPKQTALPCLPERTAAADMSAYTVALFGALTVALCWAALLTNADVSGFAYFQF